MFAIKLNCDSLMDFLRYLSSSSSSLSNLGIHLLSVDPILSQYLLLQVIIKYIIKSVPGLSVGVTQTFLSHPIEAY
jgi:hypothetical protein